MRILEELRAATTDIHQRLHSAPALCRLTEPDVTLAYYKNALKKFYGFYHSLETRYAASHEKKLHTLFSPNSTLNNLRFDLGQQGIDLDEIPISDRSVTPFTLEESLAYLYVREGSNLGGKVISRNLKDKLHLIPDIHNKFFWGHGLNTGENWKLFISTLEEFDNKIDIQSTTKFASELFSHLETWLRATQKEEQYA